MCSLIRNVTFFSFFTVHVNLLFSLPKKKKKRKKIQTTPATLAKHPGLISFFKSSFTVPGQAQLRVCVSGAHEALRFRSARSFPGQSPWDIPGGVIPAHTPLEM